MRKASLAALALLATTGCASLTPRPAPAPTAPAAAGDSAAPRAQRNAGARPYNQVITARAETREGLFKAHMVGDNLYYEIPRAELGREMLLVTQIAANTLGEGYGGEAVDNGVLVWERRGDRILLRGRRYDITADTALPVAQAVAAANYDPVIASFPVAAWGPDSAAVIDVTRLFTAPPPEFAIGNQLRGNLDRERSFVERVAAFPTNVEVEATHTFNVTPERRPGVPDQFQEPARTASVLVHWSMVRLPEDRMMPRLHDSRVGYFSIGKLDFGTEENRAARRRFITRWRLECPQGQSTPCEPVKPITYYVDPATPAKWVPYIKQGVVDWQRAFEEAGFRNAIVAADAPSPAENPDWSAEDARYSVIRWLPSTIENAQGPHVHDPRTGEILESDIKMYHNVLNLLNAWYFVQAGPLDPRAQRLPLPDSLMGRLLRYVVAHEVGHTLGFPHNQKASATYAADSLRNADFLRRMGHTPTLMDYSRFNYVAQPEDNIPPELLVPDIGPYDKFATMWGYRPIPGADTPEEELPTLNAWARMQDSIPWYRFSTEDTEGADPGDHTEAVGDADPVRSTELGLRNIRRVVPMLIPAVQQPGDDYAELERLYGRLIGQWATELSHVAIVVGGVDSQEKRWGQEGVRFEPVSAARQREAVRFLNREAFQTPDYFVRPEILRRIEVAGAIDRITAAQRRVLNQLLDNARMQRLVEFEALANGAGEAYELGSMLGDVRQGIWSELGQGRVEIDPFRRSLQRAYLDAMAGKIHPAPRPANASPFNREPPVPGEARALMRGELQALDASIRNALSRAADRTTRLHLEAARAQIDQIVNPEG